MCFLAFLTVTGFSTDLVVFGPQTYNGTGRPELVNKKFKVKDASGKFTLRVTNHGVSSAVIVLDGPIVLRPADFHNDEHRWHGRDDGRWSGRDNKRDDRGGRDERDNE